MRSSAGLTEIVIDGEDKKAKFVSPAKHNIRKGSMDRIRQSPLGTKNMVFDFSYFILSPNCFGNSQFYIFILFFEKLLRLGT